MENNQKLTEKEEKMLAGFKESFKAFKDELKKEGLDDLGEMESTLVVLGMFVGIGVASDTYDLEIEKDFIDKMNNRVEEIINFAK